MALQTKRFYEFGQFRLDATDRLLLRDGEVIPLPPKAFDILLVLVEESGQVLQKDELMRRVWPDSFVEEANLSHQVFTLRKTLGEDKNANRYIETIPRRGYRFVAAVTEISDEGRDLIVIENTRSHIVIEQAEETSLDVKQINDPENDEAKIVKTDQRLETKPKRTNTERRIGPLVLIASAAVILLGLAFYLWLSSRTGIDQPPNIRSIAVLPFKPLVADSRDEELEMGMAETLITRLGNLREMTVRPTSAVRKYTDLQQDAVEAGLGYIYARLGKRSEALEAINQLKNSDSQLNVVPHSIAAIYGALGEKDQALAWLEKAYKDHNPYMRYLKLDPRFDSLRSDPRFQELLRKLALAS